MELLRWSVGTILGLVLLGCGSAQQASVGDAVCRELTLPASSERPTGIVLVVADALRRDALGTYGGTATTPNFDAFADAHLRFDVVSSQAPWTKPAIATLFTSLYPSQHGLASDPALRSADADAGGTAPLRADVLPESLVTLAEVARDSGMRTAAFVANPWLDRRFGFSQGFELYDDSFAGWGADGASVGDAALLWLSRLSRGERFLLYLHVVDSHRPYGPIPLAELPRLRDDERRPLTSHEARQLLDFVRLEDGRTAREAGLSPTRALIRAAYRSGVERFDRNLGSLLDRLRERPEWPRLAVIVTSDHGEALYRRGYGNHGHGLFEDEVALPLAAKLPGVEPSRGHVGCPVGLVDLMPSLCGYLSIACPESVAGWSFLRRADEELPATEPRLIVSEGVMSMPRHRAVRDRRFKLLYQPGGIPGSGEADSPYAFFDLEADPHERVDPLQQDAPDSDARRSFEALRRALPNAVPPFDAPVAETAPIDPAVEERLRELGYLD